MIGLVCVVVFCFVSFKAASLDYAFLVGLYLLLTSKILFQMASRKCTFISEMQEKHPYFRKGKNDYILGRMLSMQIRNLPCMKVMMV